MAQKNSRRGEGSKAIQTLGGTFAVAELFAIDPKVVSNWHTRGLPPDTHLVLAPLLKREGFSFSPDELFKQRAMATAEERERWRSEQIEQARINYRNRKAARRHR